MPVLHTIATTVPPNLHIFHSAIVLEYSSAKSNGTLRKKLATIWDGTRKIICGSGELILLKVKKIWKNVSGTVEILEESH